jgi:hypothetical protein
VFGIERRTIRVSATPQVVRRAVRARRRRARDGIPGVWLGREAPAGVVGWVLARFLILEPVPPGCTLFNGSAWRLPIVVGAIVRARGGGAELRLRVIPPGFPYSRSPDPAAIGLLDEWLSALVAELAAA